MEARDAMLNHARREEAAQTEDMGSAKAAPCVSCPWRRENHNKPEDPRYPGYYTEWTRSYLWNDTPGIHPVVSAGLVNGSRMSCHRGDRGAMPDDAPTIGRHECAGGLILKQREALGVAASGGRTSPGGMDAGAARAVIIEAVGSEVEYRKIVASADPIAGLRAACHPMLDAPGIARDVTGR
jgi:hypothetical protein